MSPATLFDSLVDEALKSRAELSLLRPVVEKELLHHDILREMSSACGLPKRRRRSRGLGLLSSSGVTGTCRRFTTADAWVPCYLLIIPSPCAR